MTAAKLDRDAPFMIMRVEPEGGKAEPIDISDRALSFTYTDSEKKADKCTLTFENFNGDAWDEATFKKGNLLHMRWGYPGLVSPERTCVITKASGGVEMSIEAQCKSVLMHRKTLSKTYTNVRRSDVVRLIAERNGFGTLVQFIEDTDKVFDTIVQPNITDARMLKNLAHKEGFEFFVDFDGFHWHPRRVEAAPTREFRWYNGVIANEMAIISYSVENDLTAKPAKTKLKGINPRTKKPFEVTGSNAETKRTVLQEIVETRDFETGEWVQELRAASEETKPTSEQDEESAKRRADGRFRKISQKAVKMTITVIGDPLLLAKTVIIVRGICKRLDGRYYVTEVSSSVSGGYTCTLKLVTDGSRGYRGVSVNDALFPASKTGKGTGDPFGAALNLINVLNDAQDAVVIGGSAAGLPASSVISQLNALDRRVAGDPGDTGAFDEAKKTGQQILSAGSKTSNRALINAGRALVSAAQRGRSASEAARSRGELNTRPLDNDHAALTAVERDPETHEWVPKR